MSYQYHTEPRDYQKQELKKFFRVKYRALFWRVGTGKTKVPLDFMAALLHAQKIQRTLVVAPLTAIETTWQEQVATHTPDLPYSLMTSDHPVPDWSSPVIMMNYDYLSPRTKKKKNRKGEDRFFIDHFKEQKIIQWAPQLIVLDESHRIQNPHSRISKCLHKLALLAEYRMIMTGSAYDESPVQLHSQFQFLVPGLLEEKHKDFKKRYCVYSGFGGFQLIKYKNLDKLSKKIAPYVSIKKSINLPPQNFIPVGVNLPPDARKIYDKMEQDLIVSVQGRDISVPIVLAQMTKLSQITGGFIIPSGEEDEDTTPLSIHRAKLNALDEIMQSLEAQGEKRVVIFCRFRWELREIRDLLQKWCVYTIAGGVKGHERKLATQLFKSDGGVMLCQTRAGAESMNLQSANYCIFYSTEYSATKFHQACGRIHRDGQTKSCFYYLLRARGTIDTKIYQMLRDKEDVAKNFMKLIEEARNAHSRRA
jgi:SNF2 family DNA or RNA helicase